MLLSCGKPAEIACELSGAKNKSRVFFGCWWPPLSFSMELTYFVGFLDGINDSLKNPNSIEEMEADTVVSLDYDKEKLYYNMVAAKADWLYGLEQWDALLTPERRKELYKEQRSSTTVVKPPKIGRNDPCPCGSGKKYKKCCGRN